MGAQRASEIQEDESEDISQDQGEDRQLVRFCARDRHAGDSTVHIQQAAEGAQTVAGVKRQTGHG